MKKLLLLITIIFTGYNTIAQNTTTVTKIYKYLTIPNAKDIQPSNTKVVLDIIKSNKITLYQDGLVLVLTPLTKNKGKTENGQSYTLIKTISKTGAKVELQFFDNTLRVFMKEGTFIFYENIK